MGGRRYHLSTPFELWIATHWSHYLATNFSSIEKHTFKPDVLKCTGGFRIDADLHERRVYGKDSVRVFFNHPSEFGQSALRLGDRGSDFLVVTLSA